MAKWCSKEYYFYCYQRLPGFACKYCYLVGKNDKERMSWQIAKSAIDYILDNEDKFKEDSVIWDFIGGEPFLEIKLIDKICDYIKINMYKRNHHWFKSYRFNFSTNGINYDSKEVQDFIRKNYSHLSIGITIDGTQRKHDLNRIWKGVGEEKGSYTDVVKNIPLWIEQFPNAATKVTIRLIRYCLYKGECFAPLFSWYS